MTFDMTNKGAAAPPSIRDAMGKPADDVATRTEFFHRLTSHISADKAARRNRRGLELRHQAPSLIYHFADEFDTARFQLGDGFVNVVADERDIARARCFAVG